MGKVTNNNMPADDTPKAPGTASTGRSDKYAREDHVHPLQTNISGNAETATKWSNVRIIDGMSIQGDANRTTYGICSTAASTVEKAVPCTGFTLGIGSKIDVKFTVTNTATNPKLNVNGTGAKPIYYNGSAVPTGCLVANRTYSFRFNGTQYDLVGYIDTNAVYVPAFMGGGYGVCNTESNVINKTATLNGYSVKTGGIVSVKFTYDVLANSSLNINNTENWRIYYRGIYITDGIIKAGDIATFRFVQGYGYWLISLDRDFSTLIYTSATAYGLSLKFVKYGKTVDVSIQGKMTRSLLPSDGWVSFVTLEPSIWRASIGGRNFIEPTSDYNPSLLNIELDVYGNLKIRSSVEELAEGALVRVNFSYISI